MRRLIMTLIVACGAVGISVAAPATPTPIPVTVTPAAVKEGLPVVDLSGIPGIKLDRLPADEQGRPMVGRVNGRPIYARRLLGAVKRRSVAQKKTLPGQKPDAIAAALAAPVLDDLIRAELFAEYAEKNRIHVQPEEIQRYIEFRNKTLPAGKKLQDDATARGLVIAELHDEVRDVLLKDKIQQHLSYKVSPATSVQLSEFLRTNPTISPTSETVIRASHIVIRALAGGEAAANDEAFKRIEEISRAILGGMDFAEAARKYSQDRNTADLGGDLGYFARGEMYKEFDEVLFALNVGDLSAAIRTPVGYHIAKVTDRQDTNAQLLYKQAQLVLKFQEFERELRSEAIIEKYL